MMYTTGQIKAAAPTDVSKAIKKAMLKNKFVGPVLQMCHIEFILVTGRTLTMRNMSWAYLVHFRT